MCESSVESAFNPIPDSPDGLDPDGCNLPDNVLRTLADIASRNSTVRSLIPDSSTKAARKPSAETPVLEQLSVEIYGDYQD